MSNLLLGVADTVVFSTSMKKIDLCCVGHITLDKVVTPESVTFMPGGTSFYFSRAIENFDISYKLVTSLAATELHIVDDMSSSGIDVACYPSEKTLYFENIYGENPDQRTQRVSQVADPFDIVQFDGIEAQVFHLGPLLAEDISLNIVRTLAARGKVSLDAQGYLRVVKDGAVVSVTWEDRASFLEHVHYLKVNEDEMEVLTGCSDVEQGAYKLYEMGVREVIITLGSKGSVIYDGTRFYEIPAYKPLLLTDVTGCGDTYMAGYLFQRIKGADCERAGNFASAMASVKIDAAGPFTGTPDDVNVRMASIC